MHHADRDPRNDLYKIDTQNFVFFNSYKEIWKKKNGERRKKKINNQYKNYNPINIL